MEGTQREIGSSEIPFIQCNEQQLPRDHLRLKINSNDKYSRTLHPNNNCYSFTIEFEQPAAESLQHRINQCNRYQVLSIQLPIRSSLGLIYNSPHHHHMKNIIKKLPLLAAPVVKKFNAKIQHPPTTSHFIKSALGNTTYDSFIDTHEELRSLQMAIRCNSFGEHFQQSAYENVYNKKTPPSLINNELIHQATLLYSATEHSSSSSNNSYTNQPYSTYPSSTGQLLTALSAYPRIITPTSSHLSALHVDFYPNSSTSTYNKHLPDEPIGLETNITIVFYKENDRISA